MQAVVRGHVRLHRKRLEEIADELQIKSICDWYNVCKVEVYKRASFIQECYGSLSKALKSLYPEYSWDESLLNSTNYSQYHKRRIEQVAKEFNVHQLDDWYRVSRSEIYNKLPFIKVYYGNLYNALVAIYPNYPWDTARFSVLPRNYWSDPNHQRKKLDDFATEFNISTMDDWCNKLNRSEVQKKLSFIRRKYGGVLPALKSIYPSQPWHESAFQSKGYWDDLNNQKKRIEQVAKELGIKELDDWYKVSRSKVRDRLPFVQQKHGTVINALKRIYPQHPWNEAKFDVVPHGLWNTSNAQLFKDLLQEKMTTYNISQYSDWIKLPSDELKLFQKIVRNVYSTARNMLCTLFPRVEWNVFHGSSKSEKLLQDMLRGVAHVESNATIAGHSVDVFVPEWSIAIEYQGDHHFKQLHTGDFKSRRHRDALKEIELEKLGIRLIQVPFWWNTSWLQLHTTLKKTNPGPTMCTPGGLKQFHHETASHNDAKTSHRIVACCWKITLEPSVLFDDITIKHCCKNTVQKHTIVLVQFTQNKSTRQYSDFISVGAAMDGICGLFEQKIKMQNPNIKNITYDINDLWAYVDSLADLAVLVWDPKINAYVPRSKEWIKNRVYKHLKTLSTSKMQQ